MKQPISDYGPDGLLHPDRLAELERTVKDARFGYAAVDGQRYAKDVALLLEERRRLLPYRIIVIALRGKGNGDTP